MKSMPPDLKQLLFNKGPEEPLNAAEQETWEEFLETEQPVCVSLNDQIFKEALKLYKCLEEKDIITWEEFEQKVLLRK